MSSILLLFCEGLGDGSPYATAKLSTSFLARSGFQNPFSIFLHYSLKFSVFLCFSLFMAQKSNYIANGTRRWKRLRSVAVGWNDLWYKCRHVVMHSKSAPTGYRATLSESITGVCIANRGCACGVPTAIDRVTPLGSFCEVLVPSAISLLSKNQASRWVGHECYFITLFKTLLIKK